MTKRLYQEFPEDTTFWGRIVSVDRAEDDSITVELEQTLFFPTSGGQPCDTGTLNEVPVLEVIEGEGEAILHKLGPDKRTKKWAKGRELEGAVDLARRQDHMEQHSGQHLLSAVLLKTLNLDTVAFSLGATSTLEVAAPLTTEQIVALEDAVNAEIRACHPVKATEHRGAALVPTALRTPISADTMEHGVRIVSIGPQDSPIDLDPCTGTHVSSTGQLGALLILGAEIGEESTTLSFAVGRLALLALRERLGAPA